MKLLTYNLTGFFTEWITNYFTEITGLRWHDARQHCQDHGTDLVMNGISTTAERRLKNNFSRKISSKTFRF